MMSSGKILGGCDNGSNRGNNGGNLKNSQQFRSGEMRQNTAQRNQSNLT